MPPPYRPKDLMAHGQQIQVAPFDPVGNHTRNATLTAAVDLSALRPAEADKILLQCDTQNIRYTLDGTAPTATVGFIVIAMEPPILIAVSDTTQLQVIETAVGAVINYVWGT